MSDDNTLRANSTDPINQDETSSQEKPAEVSYVTAEQVQKIVEQQFTRYKQSDKDRAKAIDAKLSEVRSLLEAAGTKISTDQEQAMRDQISTQLDGAPETQAAIPSEPTVVDNFLNDVFAQVGEQVSPNDPEWKDLDKVIKDTWDDPKGMTKVILAANQAAAAKKARTQNQQQTATARVGAGHTTPVNASDISGITDSKELYRIAAQRMNKK